MGDSSDILEEEKNEIIKNIIENPNFEKIKLNAKKKIYSFRNRRKFRRYK